MLLPETWRSGKEQVCKPPAHTASGDWALWETSNPCLRKAWVPAKPTLKARFWCFKVLNMVNHLLGLHYCSHWLSFQLRLWKCNAFMPCLRCRHCSKEVAYNKFILLPSFLCSTLSTDCRNKMVQSLVVEQLLSQPKFWEMGELWFEARRPVPAKSVTIWLYISLANLRHSDIQQP